jgi:hypothetical protein
MIFELKFKPLSTILLCHGYRFLSIVLIIVCSNAFMVNMEMTPNF